MHPFSRLLSLTALSRMTRESLKCLSEKDWQTYEEECSELFDNIKPKVKNNKCEQKGGQQTGKGRASLPAGSNICKIIHSPHLLLQKITIPRKIVKMASPFVDVKFCYGIEHI